MLVMIFASSLALPMAVSWWTRDGVLFVYPAVDGRHGVRRRMAVVELSRLPA